MQIEFQNKVVVITGAVGGLGSAMVQRFVEDGAKVAICDLKGAAESAQAINKPDSVIGLDFDITDRVQVECAMNTIKEKLGKIDVLVNNAGINVGPDERKHVDKFSDKWWDAIIKVDLDGTYNCTKLAVPHMNEGASIVNISSIVGMVPLRNQCAFTAAKAAVINFTKAIAMELADKNIRANVICPGTIGIAVTNKLWQNNSAMEGLLSHIPMGRQGVPSEIANAVAFLASDFASYITGAVLPVDGGWTCGGYARNF
ncbi:MAG: SDR family oxidoreductase [Ruminococcaceae bacterium]|nr:SDR family oxidoreductase [Oscillospiraceae bacterium]